MNFSPESCVLCKGVRAKKGYTAIIIATAVLYFTVLPGDTSRSYFQLQESFCWGQSHQGVFCDSLKSHLGLPFPGTKSLYVAADMYRQWTPGQPFARYLAV